MYIKPEHSKIKKKINNKTAVKLKHRKIPVIVYVNTKEKNISVYKSK